MKKENLVVLICPVCGHVHRIEDKDGLQYYVDGPLEEQCGAGLSDGGDHCMNELQKSDFKEIDKGLHADVWLNWIESELESGNRHSFIELPRKLYREMIYGATMHFPKHLIAEKIALTLFDVI